MKCDEHLSDQSSSVGVCASCLRDRLVSLIEQQIQSKIQLLSSFDNPNLNHNPNFSRRSPLMFPQSVSPYISRRKSEGIQIFHGSPQVNVNSPIKKRNSVGKLRLISKIIRYKPPSLSKLFNSASISRNLAAVMTRRSKGVSPENEWEDDHEERETVEPSPPSWSTRSSHDRVRPNQACRPSLTSCLSPFFQAGHAQQ
ncbi:hypothetical protein RND81_01G182000 [Saponaria officinalis]|uniref:Uncharacterized protein n=1 Tax=Saponaria officinalis TaxID=3572 RepID=A0AAW1NFM3_SAPOF